MLWRKNILTWISEAHHSFILPPLTGGGEEDCDSGILGLQSGIDKNWNEGDRGLQKLARY